MNKKQGSPLFYISKRASLPWYKSWGIRAAALILALLVCALITSLVTGQDPNYSCIIKLEQSYAAVPQSPK